MVGTSIDFVSYNFNFARLGAVDRAEPTREIGKVLPVSFASFQTHKTCLSALTFQFLFLDSRVPATSFFIFRHNCQFAEINSDHTFRSM